MQNVLTSWPQTSYQGCATASRLGTRPQTSIYARHFFRNSSTA